MRTDSEYGMRSLARLVLVGTLALPVSAYAERHAMDALDTPVAEGPVADQPLTEGEVRRISKEAGRLTIRHEEIANLDMPPMTMSFHVADAAMLDLVQPGDRIRFAVERLEGKYTVTRLEPAR